MTAADLVSVDPVSSSTWRQCAALRPAPGQEEMVSPVVHSLCLCAYGGQWSPWAITRGEHVVGFAMTALRDQLAAEPGCQNVALSHTRENAAARALYAGLSFVETGETEDDGVDVVARWHPPA